MASALAVAPMVTGFPQLTPPTQAHPVKSHVHQVGFVKSSVVALQTAKNATQSAMSTPGARDPITTARAAAVTPVQDVAGAVTVVGVTWPKGAVSAQDQFQIRTFSAATWSQWQQMGVIDGGPDSTASSSATTGTDPYVVTGASKYEVRSLTTDSKVATAATVQAIDPGTSSADNVRQAPGAAAATTVKPTIYTRADWGADESKMTWTPSYGKIQVGFVHHTVDTNNYAASDVPAMIRGIYAYHAQTLGWGDIGYNFLIDRFGRTWEGRFGGMDKPVIGGQTYGYNSVSTGVAAIGDYDIAATPQAMTDAFKQIFAWKFSLAGIPATGPSPVLALDGKTPLQRVSGHRDAYATACPGQYLYDKLPEIRAGADAIMNPPPTVPPVPTGVNATPGDAQAVVWWTAPASNGGSAITGYTVTASPGGATVTTTGATTATVVGLTNGTSYTFSVTATNAVGISAASAPSAAVTPSLPGGFTGLAPTRVLDTRVGTGAPIAKVGAGASLTLTVPSLPAGVTAVAFNVAVTNPTAASFLTVYPGGTTRPTVGSNLNFVAGQTIPNMVQVPLGSGKTVTFYNNAGTVDVIADLMGYYAPGTGEAFTGKTPTRVLDTRVGTGAPTAKVGAGASLTLTVPGLPAGTTAVAFNVAVTNPTAPSFLTVYPGPTRPTVGSNLNFVAGQTIPNMVLVPLGAGNSVTFYNNAGTVDVIADLVGTFAPGTGGGFTGKSPTRVLDTRVGNGAPTAKVGAGASLTLTVPGLPAGTTAVALNVAVTNPTAASFLTVFPGGTTRPTVGSNLNYVAGQTIPNMVLVPLGAGGTVTFYNNAGTVDVIADLVGYYT